MREMTDTNYTLPLRVALYDLDSRNEVSCTTLFRYFEETAMQGSAHFGFTLEWYRRHAQFWVIRTLQLVRACAPRYLDDLEIRTWVSTMGRVRSDRNYQVRRTRDGRLLAAGIANWVYVDGAQMAPVRIHPDIMAQFGSPSAPALPPVGKVILHPGAPALLDHQSTRRVQFYEADSAQHTNNAIYVDWIEEAVRDALYAAGYRLAPDGSTPFPWFYCHTLEYARPALPGDNVEIRARLVRRGHTFGEWEIEVMQATTRAQFVRAVSRMVWVNASNQPVRWPAR
jgi:acyl-CoA thioesterase FadM